MRHLGHKKLAAVLAQHALRERDDYVLPDRHNAHENEVYDVLWEIGIHLAAFLGIAAVINVLLVMFGIAAA